MKNFKQLEIEEDFIDQELEFENGSFKPQIIGDHVYSITNGIDRIVIAADMGNGHGRVMKIFDYNDSE